MNKFTNDEMNILATAVAALVNNKDLCKIFPNANPDRTKYRILCVDGKKRTLKRKVLIALLEKVALMSGYNIGADTKDVLKGAGLR